MSNSDEYVEACREAQDALRKVIGMTEPGSGLSLHHAFNSLKTTIEKAAAHETTSTPAAESSPSSVFHADDRARWTAWSALPYTNDSASHSRRSERKG